MKPTFLNREKPLLTTMIQTDDPKAAAILARNAIWDGADAFVLQLEKLAPDQVCGTVRNIGRDGEEVHLYTLRELRETRVDMFTTVFIGNASTRNIGGRMVTPRGYARERK